MHSMSKGESAHKNKQKKRSSRFASCFSSSVIEESEDSESTSWPTEEVSRFCWSCFKKKRKTVPIMKSELACQGYRRKLAEAASYNPGSKQQQSTSLLPRISPKYQTRSHQASLRQHSKPNTVRTATRTKPPGAPEPDRTPVRSAILNRRPSSKRDALVALTMLGFALASMVVLGRAYAIVCLCACFYLLPLLKMNAAAKDGKKSSSTKLDLDSEEYKKRVVLQGLLERNGRSY